jgi:hypothetical protein
MQRSLALLKRQGHQVAIVERWNPRARKRQDLFGFLDLLALSQDGQTIGVQTTTIDHAATRQAKIEASPTLRALLRAGWVIQVHGWRKPTARHPRWSASVRALTPSGWIELTSPPARHQRDPAPREAPSRGPEGAEPPVLDET